MSTLHLGDVFQHVVLIVSFPTARIVRKAILGQEQEQPWGGQDQEKPWSGQEPLASRWVASRTRRCIDFFTASLCLIGLSPVLLLCGGLVLCTSPGPVLFRQRRMGRHGKSFVLYKFRSMRWEKNGGGPGHTVHNDLRITRVGALLRRFKLDELPQFWNVVKGDMSLVGPRPKLPHHEVLFMPYRPGLTGEATLAFRHEERMLLQIPHGEVDDFYEVVVKPIKAQLDIRYMEQATFSSDARLLARTMLRCLDCSADGRRELMELLGKHAPENVDWLAPCSDDAPNSVAWERLFQADSEDDLAGNLDDAA